MSERAMTRGVIASCLAAGGCGGTGIAIEPGQYEPPVVALHQLVGDNNYLHTDEVRYRPQGSKLR